MGQVEKVTGWGMRGLPRNRRRRGRPRRLGRSLSRRSLPRLCCRIELGVCFVGMELRWGVNGWRLGIVIGVIG